MDSQLLDVPGDETFQHMVGVLLTEIRVSQRANDQVQSWLIGFKEFVSDISPFEADSLDWLNHVNVKIPLPKTIYSGNLNIPFKWRVPNVVDIIGSYALHTSIAKVSQVDVLIEIPKECLSKSDLINHKYHIKRALYLSYIAGKLDNDEPMNFICPDGNPLRPVLEVQVTKDMNIRLHVVPPQDFFKVSRLLPDKNNLRFCHFYPALQCEEAESTSKSTPQYNNSIAVDVLMKSNMNFMQTTLDKNKVYRDAVVLLKVWLQQRNLNEGYGSFSNFIITEFVCHLIDSDKITSAMGIYQIIRIIMVNLSKAEWNLTGISLQQKCSKEIVETWHVHCPVVFLDETGILNFASQISEFTYSRVKYEATQVLQHLNEVNVSNFQWIFMKKVPFLNNFDHILQIFKIKTLEREIEGRQDLQWTVLDHSGHVYPIAITVVGQLIKKCFGGRLNMIDVDRTGISEWKITNVPSYEGKMKKRAIIRFGLRINREVAYKLVEKCEASDNPQVAADFKKFWGDKSELRRFRDGSMFESVVFDTCKERVCFEMLKYTLERHLTLKLDLSLTSYLDVQIDKLFAPEFQSVEVENVVKKEKHHKGPPPNKRLKKVMKKKEILTRVTVDEVTADASKSTDKLSKLLRQLEDLPLSITSVQGISPVLRCSQPFPTPPQRFFSSKLISYVDANLKNCLFLKTPGRKDVNLMKKVPKYVEPIIVLVQLESSGKWPDDIKAIEHLKCSFLIRIGQLLKEKFGLVVQPSFYHLDILLDGFIFRIRLTYLRELILLKEIKDLDGVIKVQDNVESLKLEREAVLLPQLTSTLHSFQHQFEPFGKICRLAKRWLASNLMLAIPSTSSLEIDSRFTEESVELLVASLFLNYKPYLGPPNEIQVGFLRFLHLLAFTDFRTTPIIVNFNQTLTKVKVDDIEREFTRRGRDKMPALFIVTPQDTLCSVWTKNVHGIILQRVSLLAQAALEHMTSMLVTDFSDSNEMQLCLQKIFSPSMTHFDVIIWLHKEMNSTNYQNVHRCANAKLKFRKYSKHQDEFIPIVDFDPVRSYIQELRETYGNLALFLNNVHGGDFIAVVWKPDTFKSKNVIVSNGKEHSLESPSVEKVLQDFEQMGAGIFNRLEFKTENWHF